MIRLSEKTLFLLQEEHKKCINCKACMTGCPMFHRFCQDPLELLEKLEEQEAFPLDLPFSCMLCGYCRKVCPAGVDIGRLMLEFRREAVQNGKGRLPREIGKKSIDLHQSFSFSPFFTRPVQALQSDTVFFPGCALISYSPELVEKTFRYLRTRIPGLGYSNKCCGKPTRFMGDERKFQDRYLSLTEEFREKGIRRVVTGCQNCYRTIRDSSPDLEVVSLWDFLAQDGIPKDRAGAAGTLEISVTLHDPCPTRDEDTIHRSVRLILGELGLEYQEMQYNKGLTLCCGSGGMVPVTQNPVAVEHMKQRAGEADTEYIVTYCQECVHSMRRGGKKAWHLLDLLFNEEFQSIPQENLDTLSRWKNRRKGRTLRLDQDSLPERAEPDQNPAF